MKTNKKGFTLIELLAVIVVLGIIALIAVPTIGEMTDNARKKAFINSAYGLLKAANQYYSEKVLVEDGFSKKEFEFPNNISGLEFDGKVPQSGEIWIDEDGKISIAVSNGRYCARKGKLDREIFLSETEEECYIWEDTILNGAEPELKVGMIPVIISNDGTVTKASTVSKWHDYANKEWANAVTVNEDVRTKYLEADIGTTIAEEDILTYFVWIPRYKYELWNVESSADNKSAHSINIVFENKDTTKSTGNQNGQYLTHPAFTFGDEELDGIWVGKFETGYNGATTKTAAQLDEKDSNKIVIKPNIYSWRRIKLVNMYYNALEMNYDNNVYGFSNDSDTHMMKNTEWGAIAYLSHSKYGFDGEVYINNCSSFLTGCGGDSANATSSSSCKNAYGTKAIYNQSTTGNISGVFDMSGGAYEYVMGYNKKASDYGSSGFTNVGDTKFPSDSKYFDEYSSTKTTDYATKILGDAVGEVYPSWYGTMLIFPISDIPFFVRGGVATSSNKVDIFSANNGSGVYASNRTFRVVIS